MRKLWIFGVLMALTLSVTACDGSDRMSVGDDGRAYTTWDGDSEWRDTHRPDDHKNAGKTHGTSFEKMLENARVHDRDGKLLDGENSRS